MTVLGDFHIHTYHSHGTILRYDALHSPEDMARAAKFRGLDFIAITDHNTTKGINPAVEQGRRSGVVVMPGIEITKENKHILVWGDVVYNFGTDFKSDEYKRLVESRSMAEICEYVIDEGGVTGAPHAYAFYGLGNLIDEPYIMAVETYNSNASPIANLRARFAADRLGKIKFGGSDSHIVDTVGNVVNEVYADSDDIDGILDALKKGKVEIVKKRPTSVGQIKRFQLERYELNKDVAERYIKYDLENKLSQYLGPYHLAFASRILMPFALDVFKSSLKNKLRTNLLWSAITPFIYCEDLLCNMTGLIKDLFT